MNRTRFNNYLNNEHGLGRVRVVGHHGEVWKPFFNVKSISSSIQTFVLINVKLISCLKSTNVLTNFKLVSAGNFPFFPAAGRLKFEVKVNQSQKKCQKAEHRERVVALTSVWTSSVKWQNKIWISNKNYENSSSEK